ncbi:MAG: polymer-forming cytoskeletal protein [Candidatus Andersenbacteria bacterium]|nr:polymer-forming cytoskeletal protein [Candidatus Andersenbacteria bacterium]MBI3250378.1 polymer-forming cytoskeletal protein [Candidatus Andersenbacteria bacterium]
MNYKTLLAVFAVFTLIASIAQPSLAATFVHDEREVTTVSDPVADDLYLFGNVLSIEAPITGDVTSAGKSVEITGSVSQDIYAAGQSVSIMGATGDDVHVAGESVRITSEVTGDVFVAGQNLTLTEDSSVGDDLYAGGSDIIIAGKVGGDVRVASEQVTIKSTARIDGDVQVASDKDPIIEEGAIIGGELKRIHSEVVRPKPVFQAHLANWVRQVVSLFVVALLLLLIFPRVTQNLLTTMQQSPLKRLGVGFLWMVLLIPTAILLLISIIGWPLAFALIAGTVVAGIISTGAAALLVGQWVMRKTSPNSTSNLTWTHALLGAVVYQTIQLIPVVGWLVACVIVLIALGSIARLLIPQRTSTPSPTV